MESTASSLVGTVGQLLGEEYRQLSGVGREVAELRDDLATMNALLRMQSEAADGAVDHFIREWMKQLRELAYDAEDCVDHYRLRVRCRPGDGFRGSLKRRISTLLLRRRLAAEITALRSRALSIGDRHARYGINRDALQHHRLLITSSSSSSTSAPMLPAANAPRRDNNNDDDDDDSKNINNEQQLVGIKGQADALVELLKVQQQQQHTKVLSIVGFGGVGKTTLAMEVCRLLETDFPYLAKVSVSQAFDPVRDLRELLKRVLLQVVEVKTENEILINEDGKEIPRRLEPNIDGAKDKFLDEIDKWDADTMILKLQDYLKDKRYSVCPS
uniref:Rx N-terminal domain-containing protein n=1 Tax=Leersia perrieri TaxID=77586 RepID=A0A0D9XHI1_9ORYZ